MRVTYCRYELVHDSNVPGIKYEIGPYVGCEHRCSYCYALNDASTNWSEEVRAHEGLEEQLEYELSLLPPGTVLIGRDTDPYQPCPCRDPFCP